MPIPAPPPTPRPRRRDRLEETPATTGERQAAQTAHNALPGFVTQAAADTPHDWITLECLANNADYAKSDTRKRFILWEATTFSSVHVTEAANLRVNHPWLAKLFLPNGATVRFPFNTGDSSEIESLSWWSASRIRKRGGRFYELPRWSTASRSSVALIPEMVRLLERPTGWEPPDRRCEWVMRGNDKVNIAEWYALQRVRQGYAGPERFSRMVNDIGAAARTGLVPPGRLGKWRLYSVKTGVNYVGTKKEGGRGVTGGKHLLEANSTAAMLRSEVAAALPNNDDTFGLQGELLTVTAPMDNGTRDGFQVRDLSCMRPRLRYVPGQAIPYAHNALDDGNTLAFWRENFSYLLGRAKARMFLNYGLCHLSANSQNFLLGCDVLRTIRVRQFVVRDLGDTSWHDDFIAHYLSHFNRGLVVFRAVRREAGEPSRLLLRRNNSGQYPPPEMLRLAAFSIITHGFAARLGLSYPQRYEFVSGVFDGFVDFVNDAIGVDMRYAQLQANNGLGDQAILSLGLEGKYTHLPSSHTVYKRRVEEILAQDINALLSQARWVRAQAARLLTTQNDQQLEKVLSAEEISVCGALEKHLRDAGQTERVRIRTRLQHCFAGNWPRVVP
ncbi:MAG: hypothetical protein Tsb0020_43960 [Haliangiales bacterium]